MKPILEINHIGKKYNINRVAGGYLSLRERLVEKLAFRRNHTEEFWALNDISFSVEQGDSIGIIGRNGAGKSTLLKILSKITPPTTGRIISRGRIASLLEVGTGFHQELTGRENVFFNGSLLGMKRKEIDAKFDEIVDFSGTEKFLDTPLKHYSSGMQLRLAFAVAAFLEPEIMIIDEVLAVGDAEFQKKCLGKMEDVSRSGRTILFVSHNLDSIERFCKQSVWLDHGKLVTAGSTHDVVTAYLTESDSIVFKKSALTSTVTLEEFSVVSDAIATGESLQFSIKISNAAKEKINMTDLCFLIYNNRKQRVAIFDLRPFFKSFQETEGGLAYAGEINRFNLVEGEYSIGIFYGINTVYRDVYDLVKVRVRSEAEGHIFTPYDVRYRGYVELK